MVSIASTRGGSEGKGSSIPPSSSEVLWTHTRDARRDMLGADWVGYSLAACTGHSLVRFWGNDVKPNGQIGRRVNPTATWIRVVVNPSLYTKLGD